MGLTSALNTAVFGLGYNQRQLDVTAANIANADTAGYSKKRRFRQTPMSMPMATSPASKQPSCAGSSTSRSRRITSVRWPIRTTPSISPTIPTGLTTFSAPLATPAA
ncbi:flagellar basal body protein [Roseibium salinum]|nr:flagellar basal body protein [Roseibium salinum]